jgi:hypothetical protein
MVKPGRRWNPRGSDDLAALGIVGGRKVVWWNPSPINRVGEWVLVRSP